MAEGRNIIWDYFNSKDNPVTGWHAMQKIIDCTKKDNLVQGTHGIKELFEKYKDDPLEETAFAYWKKMSMSTNLVDKYLADIAKQYLTPPPTSVDVERLFSIAGLILSAKKNILLPHNAEMLFFCRENLPKVNFEY